MGKLADAAKNWGQAMKRIRSAANTAERSRAESDVRDAFDQLIRAYLEQERSTWDDADRTADAIFGGLE